MSIFNRNKSKDVSGNNAQLNKEIEQLEQQRKKMEADGQHYTIYDKMAVKGIQYESAATIFAIAATKAFENKEYEKAIAFMTREFTYYNPVPTLLELRAKSYTMTGDFENALRDIDRALAIMPDHYLCNTTKAGILERRGDYRGAINALTKAIALLPDEKQYYFLRAKLYWKINEPDKAGADNQKFAELNKNQAQ
jgi:tetratricopeptide (TPR) repeat protein